MHRFHCTRCSNIMQLWMYDKVLEFKGKDPLKRHKNHTYTVAEDAFRCDLGNGKTIWTNAFWEDYRSYIQNNHLLWSIFSVSSLHPFSRTERMSALFNEICLAFSIFVLFEKLNLILLFGENGHKCMALAEAFITSSFALTLQKFGTCSKVQNASDDKRKRCERLGDIALTIISIITTVTAVTALYAFLHTNTHMELNTWFSAQTLSWIIDLFVAMIQFVKDAIRERRDIAKGKCDLCVTYVDYMKWKESLMSRHKDRIDTKRHIPSSVQLVELAEMESTERRPSLYPMLDDRDSINSGNATNIMPSSESHYVIDSNYNVTETNDVSISRLSDKYPHLKDKKMIIFLD
eukprot:425941_1